jgi:hypothetical protein
MLCSNYYLLYTVLSVKWGQIKILPLCVWLSGKKEGVKKIAKNELGLKLVQVHSLVSLIFFPLYFFPLNQTHLSKKIILPPLVKD